MPPQETHVPQGRAGPVLGDFVLFGCRKTDFIEKKLAVLPYFYLTLYLYFVHFGLLYLSTHLTRHTFTAP